MALWLLVTHFSKTPPAGPSGTDIQVVLLHPPSPVSTSVPTPSLISPATDEVGEPEINISAAPSDEMVFPIVAIGNIVPPRPDPAFLNQSPALPPNLQNLGKGYEVELVIRVETDGHVGATKIARSCGDGAVDQFAEHFAAANWRFRPAVQNGIAVAAWTTVAVTFQQTG